MTQAEQLYAAIRLRPMTTMELLQMGVSVAPWKRISEGVHHLKPGERVVKERNWRGLVTYAVKKAA
jgi:hypothetical protein